MNTRLRALILAGCALCVATSVATVTYRVTIWVDYNSGTAMKVTTLACIRVHSEPYGSTHFAQLVMTNGTVGLSGGPDWHRALVFPRGSRISANYEGGQVLNCIKELDLDILALPAHRAAELKEGFLRRVAAGDIQGARALVKSLSLTLEKTGD